MDRGRAPNGIGHLMILADIRISVILYLLLIYSVCSKVISYMILD